MQDTWIDQIQDDEFETRTGDRADHHTWVTLARGGLDACVDALKQNILGGGLDDYLSVAK